MSSSSNEFIIMWDIYGLEHIIDVTKVKNNVIISALKGEKIDTSIPLQHMLLRANANPQRHYEIYHITTTDISEEDLKEQFKECPQFIVDLIRERGDQIYSNREIPSNRVIV